VQQDFLKPRQQEILNLLNTNGEVKISTLSSTFAVTEMTIRRDLEKLEQAGYAKRTFGGAIHFESDMSLVERVDMMKDEKSRIGRRAAELILPGESIFIDAGTTTVQISRYLHNRPDITVVTNALNVASELLNKGITTIIIGGSLIDATSSTAGALAISTLSSMAFDRVFLGATGFTAQHGFSNSNLHEAEVKKAAVKQAAEVNVVLDHTKFGAKALFSYASLQQVHRIITDRRPDHELANECLNNHVHILEC
jgi:DeoR family fructose operon transcriptional repressor